MGPRCSNVFEEPNHLSVPKAQLKLIHLNRQELDPYHRSIIILHSGLRPTSNLNKNFLMAVLNHLFIIFITLALALVESSFQPKRTNKKKKHTLRIQKIDFYFLLEYYLDGCLYAVFFFLQKNSFRCLEEKAIIINTQIACQKKILLKNSTTEYIKNKFDITIQYIYFFFPVDHRFDSMCVALEC